MDVILQPLRFSTREPKEDHPLVFRNRISTRASEGATQYQSIYHVFVYMVHVYVRMYICVCM